ncbi:hypothetical protein CRV00_09915 [Malaciobacter molluscorum]|uniref:hypothetical protein n=1 Tax=Malaciobacter molluscorum TaxID=1032072 RepID=UPI00100AE860|nr:hypothetical protein [Malaciobacter molluscorum]RXJ93768.1 hypothetical protein CRV00_09915 [Malaciobacter molluscorum]
MNTKTTHLINIINGLLKGNRLSSIDIKASNSNQYFCTIKNNGIELIEVKKPNLTNKGYHLERRLNLTQKNINKAKKYLHKLINK